MSLSQHYLIYFVGFFSPILENIFLLRFTSLFLLVGRFLTFTSYPLFHQNSTNLTTFFQKCVTYVQRSFPNVYSFLCV